MNSWRTVIAQPDQLGESPFWHPEDRKLYWVDIPARQIRRADPHSGPAESWAMPLEPGCIAPVRGGGFVMAHAKLHPDDLRQRIQARRPCWWRASRTTP